MIPMLDAEMIELIKDEQASTTKIQQADDNSESIQLYLSIEKAYTCTYSAA